MIKFSVKDGLWKVTKFIQDHNHELALPSEVHLLRSNRDVTIDKGKVIDTMVNSGISTKNVYSYMSTEVGGCEFVGFTKRDCYNHVNKQKLILIEGGDSQSLINHFKLRQTEDPMFFYSIQVDEESIMTNFFWRDGGCMHDYDSFGDVVIFDTTFRTNRYNLVCAPFVGVNHHWQNVMFGCAFLLNEKTESFKWLFTSFLESMGGKAPKTIFTDEDQAMANAIEEVFPNTSHRLCLWHISKNASSHLGHFNSDKEFRNLFYECLMHCDSEFEFEETWRKLMNQFEGLKDNSWLQRLYGKRNKWCTGLNKDYFSADIKSTQRSESTNSCLNGLANKTTSLTNFVLGFEKLIAGWREGEASEDFRCKQGIPLIKIKNSSILKSVARGYTLKMYKVFEDAFLDGIAKTWREVSSLENVYTFEVIGEGRDPKTRTVVFNADTLDISCTCKKFESMGMLCSDALRILSVKNVKVIPEKYILKRWTRSAKANVIKSMESEDSSKRGIEETETIFRNHLMSRAYKLFFRSQ
ncbi:FAR1-related sequence 5 [Euphorbia peplus]|nr:FAR1-related sequence 5 [Euphorbia peplus]